MSCTFSQLQDEVKHRSTRNQAGTDFDTSIKNSINSSLFRIARESRWRPLRRKSYFTTVPSYITGSGGVIATSNSTAVTITSAAFQTADIQIDRRIKISGDSTYFTIRAITGETTLTLDKAYSGSSTSAATYEIFPQEIYNLPIQATHQAFLWHEDYGYPYLMNYIPEQEFISNGNSITDKGTPEDYRMWGEDMVIEQVKTPSIVSIVSSSASDTAKTITVFGTASGYPDYDTITLNGTSAVTGAVTFSSVERIVKADNMVGRITVSANSSNDTLAVLPVGNTTSGIRYSKVGLYPLPDSAFDINVYYYKEPFRLVNDGDVHELGQEFDECIILLSVAKIKGETEQNGAASFYALYQDELKSLKRIYSDKIDWLPTLGRRYGKSVGRVQKYLNYSQIGSQFGRSSFR